MKLKVINLQFPSCLSLWEWLWALIWENESRICQLYLGKAPSLTRWCTLLVSITSSHGLTGKSMSMSSWKMSRFAKSAISDYFKSLLPYSRMGRETIFRFRLGQDMIIMISTAWCTMENMHSETRNGEALPPKQREHFILILWASALSWCDLFNLWPL